MTLNILTVINHLDIRILRQSIQIVKWRFSKYSKMNNLKVNWYVAIYGPDFDNTKDFIIDNIKMTDYKDDIFFFDFTDYDDLVTSDIYKTIYEKLEDKSWFMYLPENCTIGDNFLARFSYCRGMHKKNLLLVSKYIYDINDHDKEIEDYTIPKDKPDFPIHPSQYIVRVDKNKELPEYTFDNNLELYIRLIYGNESSLILDSAIIENLFNPLNSLNPEEIAIYKLLSKDKDNTEYNYLYNAKMLLGYWKDEEEPDIDKYTDEFMNIYSEFEDESELKIIKLTDRISYYTDMINKLNKEVK